MDDIFICAPNEEILVQRIEQVLDKCRLHKVTISKKKFEIGKQMNFAGFHVTSTGVTPDDSKVNALKSYPAPKNIHKLRSFLGLANQLGGFVEMLAAKTEPMQQLLKKGTAYAWTEDLQKAFMDTKTLLASPAIVHFFDPSLQTTLLSDASNLNGLGYALTQEDKEGKTRLIQCGSRGLTDPETRYAPVELEALGILWATEKARHYLLGNPSYKVVTDHAPYWESSPKTSLPSITEGSRDIEKESSPTTSSCCGEPVNNTSLLTHSHAPR